MNTPLLTASITLALLACSGPGTAPATEGDKVATDPHSMRYTKVDTPDTERFAKVSAGDGTTYAEGIIDAAGTEIIPPLNSILIDDSTGSTALVRNGRGCWAVDAYGELV